MKKSIHFIITLILIGVMSFSSLASDMHIYDEAGLLEAEDLVELDSEASRISDKYGYGVYAIIVNDYQKYSLNDIFTAATEMYHGLGLGEGENREGILLLLSMTDRDYATFFYGNNVEYAFNDYGQIQLEDQFLDDFAEDEWSDGLEDYLDTCDEFLGLALEGKPVRESHKEIYTIIVIISIVLAFIGTKGIEKSMKSVYKGSSAESYVTKEGLNLTESRDHYLYTTQTRRKIESSSSRSGSGSGSSSHSGGGGSGRSGKF